MIKCKNQLQKCIRVEEEEFNVNWVSEVASNIWPNYIIKLPSRFGDEYTEQIITKVKNKLTVE